MENLTDGCDREQRMDVIESKDLSVQANIRI